jgi:membrane-bound lytic murein transglycosylase B
VITRVKKRAPAANVRANTARIRAKAGRFPRLSHAPPASATDRAAPDRNHLSMIQFLAVVLALALSGSMLVTTAAAATPTKTPPAAVKKHPGQDEFVREVMDEARKVRPELKRAHVEAILADAKYQQSIIDAMTRPAEGKPWHAYRPIFMTEKRIADGAAFYRENAKVLDPIAKQYGVPPEMIVAIIGVETNYGRITGKYRVVDALATLAFYYPARAPFFRAQLRQLLLLPEKEFPLPLNELTGSYAGAMGWGQFMPTSLANFGRDQDGDGRIDLWNSRPDVFASVANYFIGHGWATGQPVVTEVAVAEDARKLTPSGYEPIYSVGQLGEWGYRAPRGVDPNLQATLLRLDAEKGDEFWITHQNFFVITRYNRSPLYAMAVHQLADAIAAAHAAAPSS